MAPALQQKILAFVSAGGSLLLHGRIPRFDADGSACRILADALEATDFAEQSGWRRDYDMAITQTGFLANGGQYFCNEYETFTVSNAEVLLKTHDGDRTCGFYKAVGAGKVVVISVNYKCYLPQYARIKAALGAQQALTHDIQTPGVGVFMTMTVNAGGDRFLYLINMDDIDKDFTVYHCGKPLFSRPIHLPADDALTLPLNVRLPCATVVSATAEISGVSANAIRFRNTEKRSEIRLATTRAIAPAPYISAAPTGDGSGWTLHTDNRLLDDEITVSLL
jgi:beta-galactosidase